MPLAPQELRTFFVTSVIAQMRRIFQVERNANLLIDVMESHRQKNRFLLHAFTIMPDHIHLLLTPAPDIALEKAMQYIKGGFSFQLKSELDVWERSFAEHRIKDATDYDNHVTYIEQNAVRAHLASCAQDFAFSSASLRHHIDPMPHHLKSRRAEG